MTLGYLAESRRHGGHVSGEVGDGIENLGPFRLAERGQNLGLATYTFLLLGDTGDEQSELFGLLVVLLRPLFGQLGGSGTICMFHNERDIVLVHILLYIGLSLRKPFLPLFETHAGLIEAARLCGLLDLVVALGLTVEMKLVFLGRELLFPRLDVTQQLLVLCNLLLFRLDGLFAGLGIPEYFDCRVAGLFCFAEGGSRLRKLVLLADEVLVELGPDVIKLGPGGVR